MALQFMDGFDNVDVLAATGTGFQDALKTKYENADVTSYTDAVLVAGRLGGVCLDWGNDQSKWLVITITGSPSEVVIGFALRTPNDQNGNKLVSIRNSSAWDICNLSIDYYNRLYVETGSTRVCSMDQPLNPETWYYVEWKIKPDDVSGATQVRVNGDTVCQATGVDTQLNAPPITQVVFWGQEPGSALDDIYVCDTTGTVNNSFLGPCMVESLRPSADTTDVDFVPSTGTDHYALVDEVPCDYGSSHVDGQTTGDQDRWAYEDLSDIDGTVHGLQVWSIAAATTGSFTLRTVADDGTTHNTDTAKTVSTTTYVGVLRCLDQTPNAGSWSVSVVNGSSFGVEVG